MPDAAPPRIFISYSHDSPEHQNRVLALADQLRDEGVDVSIDQYVQSPPEGWADWCETEIRKSDFVLMVCTETYLRRVNHEEEPGKGYGVLWEARLIRQHLYDLGSASRKFVPVIFADGSSAHVPTPVKGASIHQVDTAEGYEPLYRLLTDQPLVRKRELGTLRLLPERPRQWTGQPPAHVEPAISGARQDSPKLAVSLPHPRVEDLFVGRSEERKKLAAALFPTSGARRPVVVSGMAGVGKSYLVDRFFWENADRFLGGYLRLVLDPDKPASAADLLTNLRDRLKLPAGDGVALAARLLTPLTLLHIENTDSFEAGRVVGELVDELPGCALVVSARFRRLGSDAGWREVPLAPLDERTALEQLRAELGEDAPRQESWPALVAALGFLPLALHLAAGYLRADHRADAFLRRLRAKNLALAGADPVDPTFRGRSRALLSDTFELSLAALHREGGAEGDNWLAGFSALGHAPAAGFGESLGAAITGLIAQTFDDMALDAARLSLLDRAPRGVGNAFRLHPLLAELARSRADKDAAVSRMTEWFVARLPQGGEEQGRRWREIHEEFAATTEWLAQVSPADRVRVARAGVDYAINNGPYHAWIRLCDDSLTGEMADADRSSLLWTLGQVALSGGVPDRALAAAKEKRQLDLKRGADREAALAAGLVADILNARGQLDEALKIRNEEELPVYERLGDVRERAVTMGRIADILQDRGQLDEALKIRNEEELPVYERLGGVRERTVAIGKIADILQARGQLDEALKIRNEELLPVYERLGDVRSRAVTMGRIADISQARGQLDEALRIRYDEQLPVFERLGDVHERAVTMGRIANILQARGDLDGSLRVRREEELPVYERLGNVRYLLFGRWNLASTLLRRGREQDREEARGLLLMALDEARRLKLPEALQIEQLLEQAR
jgi:tetratricopeptide (TPR) repeat protein